MSTPPRRPRAVIFDLDETLLDSRRAWQYAVEEAFLSVIGRRIDAGLLVAEYRRRPWRHAFAVLAGDPSEVERCAETAETMYYRSAMKRLLVHEGIGMGLDRIRAARIEIAAISREPHAHAIRQIESTGLDRFVTVLSPTPPGTAWTPSERIEECRGYLGYAHSDCAFFAGDLSGLREAERLGLRLFRPAWVEMDDGPGTIVGVPGEIEPTLTRAWARLPG